MSDRESPSPKEESRGADRTGSSILLAAASVVVVLAGLRAAAPFLVPLVLALFLSIINLPVLEALRRRRVPTPAAIALVVLLTFGLLGLVGWVGIASLREIRVALPAYLARLQQMEREVVVALQTRGIPVPDGFYEVLAGPERLLDMVSGILLQAAGFLSLGFVVLLYTIFMLAEAAGFPRKLRAAIGRGDADLSRMATAVREIQRYLAIKTAISLATGLLVGLWLWLLGVDFALLWGTVAFMLNYVPNVGSVLAAIPGVSIALLQLGPADAALAAAGYLVINFLLGNLLEPNLMGRRFGLSTLVVVVSLLFWGWLWGPVGMLLSVPLTVLVRIALEHTRDLRWLAVLLSSGPRDAPAAAVTEARSLPAPAAD